MAAGFQHHTTSTSHAGSNALDDIFLTFDDGPDPRHTPKLLDLLAERQAKATFFVRGARAARFAYLIRRIQREGHSIGHLGYRFVPPILLTAMQARDEVDRASQLLEDLLGERVRLFRPPFLHGHQAMLMRASQRAQRIVTWDLTVPDFWPLCCHQRILATWDRVAPGMTIKLHDGDGLLRRPSLVLPTLNRFIFQLQFKGLRCAAIPSESSDELLRRNPRKQVLNHSQGLPDSFAA